MLNKNSVISKNVTRKKPLRNGLRLALGLVLLWFGTASIASAAAPVRVLIAEGGHPNFSQLSCPNGPGITGSCRIFKRIHCPQSGGGVCYEDTAGPTTDHATVVTNLAVYGSDPDVQAIVASGSPHYALNWAIQNRDRFNIRVVTRTDGVAGDNSGCSNAQIYQNAFNKGIAVVFSSGNQGRNGVDRPFKRVIPDSCGPNVIGVGFTGRGFVTHGPNGPVCSDDPPAGGDNTPFDTITIDCQANARPGNISSADRYVDFFTDGRATAPLTGSGSSFAAPRVAALFANYFTQNPDSSVSSARSFINGFATNLPVTSSIAGVSDTYRELRPTALSSIHNQLSNKVHAPTSGYYFNPERPGWGLHVSTLGNDVYLIWYTYDTNGKPLWFTAYANTYGRQTMTASIREERKISTFPPTHTNFGSVRLEFINPTSFKFRWDFAGRYPQAPGEERMELLLGNGRGIGGQWFNPNDPGWGMSIEAANATSGTELVTLFYFDAAGRPVWASGQTSNGGPSVSLQMVSYQGFCQGCPAIQPIPSTAGTLSHTLYTNQWGVYENGNARIDLGGIYPFRPNNGGYVPLMNLFP